MKILVTGSTGHLGEAVMRRLASTGHQAIGVDILGGPFTRKIGTIVDRDFVRSSMS